MAVTSYRWACLSCGSGNNAESSECSTCGCPAIVSGLGLREWQYGNESPPRKPSLFHHQTWGPFYWLFEKLAPCPRCGLLMNIRSTQCAHCFHHLTELEQAEQKHHDREVKRIGLKGGLLWSLIVFPCLFVLFRVLWP